VAKTPFIPRAGQMKQLQVECPRPHGTSDTSNVQCRSSVKRGYAIFIANETTPQTISTRDIYDSLPNDTDISSYPSSFSGLSLAPLALSSLHLHN